MNIFSDKLKTFMSEFGKGRKMVLSTSENNIVSSRMMSVVQIGGEFYFQTDVTMKKYHQLSANDNVALCIDNIQIEGKCTEIGHPLNNALFCETFQECFKGSYDAYSSLENERVFVVKPLRIERWLYKDGIPYIESFDICSQRYSAHKYLGV
ncbi:pyridoxamine 5'-phosphate oxidase family protein [Ruminococcus sp.]|uniref:pyridoxamine 5'-phosphate oxidase family protein n=1 Tax=Ruminococcus sp. TaxID=41978 RepID=UPI0025DEDEC5|nr:pyridoxamine 5'-phosphate oxidase family protein [Ruminococcus sp.]MBQ9542784.1 pyridoxamine 5'-phosphate oxidase family protein [Ruminococcus sp.]